MQYCCANCHARYVVRTTMMLWSPTPPSLTPELSKNDIEKRCKSKKSRKNRVRNDALQALRDAVKAQDEIDQTSSATQSDAQDLNTKVPEMKKKPKTHFRKTKKPGRA